MTRRHFLIVMLLALFVPRWGRPATRTTMTWTTRDGSTHTRAYET